MSKKFRPMCVVLLMILGGFAGFLHFGSEVVQGTDVSGFIDTDQTWTPGGSPYIVIDNLYILFDVTLTIEPGVHVKFDGDYYIALYGNLTANGTESNRIVFTSNLADPHMGDWSRIEVEDSGHIEMRYCDIAYGGLSIYLHKSGGHIFENSYFYDNVISIYLNASSNNRFINNIFLDNPYNAIHLDVSADNNLIADNTFDHCSWCVKLWDSNSNNSILNNSISNSWLGIFSQTGNNTIANNTIFQNEKGIMFDISAHNNRVYHNNFLDNTVQVETYGDDNFWNGTYPSGGNFWSDYVGVDLNSTPSQDVPPSDGFGDSPYIINQDNRDEYPLMNPSPGAPPAVVWMIEPPDQMNRGTSYEVSWIVVGDQTTSHTNIHYSQSELFDTYGETDVKSGSPGIYSDSISCPTEGIHYFKLHAVINGQDYFSKVVRVECASLPEIEHTCIDSAETTDYVVINATVTSDNVLSKVYVNYSNSSQSEELSMVHQANNVWSVEILTPPEMDNITYYIVAEDSEGYSNKTSVCTIEVTLDVTPPGSPKDFGVRPGEAQGEYRLSWKRSEDDTVQYNIYRATTQDGDYQKIGTVEQSDCGGIVCAYTDTNLAVGATYWYKISAVDEAGNESPLSEAVSAHSEFPLWLILLIVAIVAIIIVAVILAVLGRRKRRRMAMEEQVQAEEPASSEESQATEPQPEQPPPTNPPKGQ
jgi:parallel beta-helix repeat protein